MEKWFWMLVNNWRQTQTLWQSRFWAFEQFALDGVQATIGPASWSHLLEWCRQKQRRADCQWELSRHCRRKVSWTNGSDWQLQMRCKHRSALPRPRTISHSAWDQQNSALGWLRINWINYNKHNASASVALLVLYNVVHFWRKLNEIRCLDDFFGSPLGKRVKGIERGSLASTLWSSGNAPSMLRYC